MTTLATRNDLAEMLRRCRTQFAFYETNHREKADKLAREADNGKIPLVHEALVKADVNLAMVKAIDELLYDDNTTATLDEPTEADLGPQPAPVERPSSVEITSLLYGATAEIEHMRRRVADLEPRAHAYDTLAVFARLSAPQEHHGYGLDLVWELRGAIDRMQSEPDTTKAS